MEATETITGLWRAFPDLAQVPGSPEPTLVGFVSRAWRPIELAHAPVAADLARRSMDGGPAWTGSVPARVAGSSVPDR